MFICLKYYILLTMPNGYEEANRWKRIEYNQGIIDRRADAFRPIKVDHFMRPLPVEPRPLGGSGMYYKAGYEGVPFKFDF